MKYLTKDYLTKLDKSINMIPLYADCMFKSIFTYDLDILKEFVITELNIKLNPKKTSITLLNNELPKDRLKEYKKTIDIFVKLNNKIYVNLELNNSSFNKYLIV